jgi:hypothetical protein
VALRHRSPLPTAQRVWLQKRTCCRRASHPNRSNEPQRRQQAGKRAAQPRAMARQQPGDATMYDAPRVLRRSCPSRAALRAPSSCAPQREARPLDDGVGGAGDTGPQVGALLGDRASDGRAWGVLGVLEMRREWVVPQSVHCVGPQTGDQAAAATLLRPISSRHLTDAAAMRLPECCALLLLQHKLPIMLLRHSAWHVRRAVPPA